MNVSLTKRQKQYVQARVRSGRYQSASEVVREALRVLETFESQNERLEYEVQKGIDSIEAGRFKPGNAKYWRDLNARLHRQRRKVE